MACLVILNDILNVSVISIHGLNWIVLGSIEGYSKNKIRIRTQNPDPFRSFERGGAFADLTCWMGIFMGVNFYLTSSRSSVSPEK